MTAYRLDTENVTVIAYRSRKEAGCMGNNLPIVDSEEAILDASITTNDIRSIFNKLTNENVKKFSTRKAGARRLWEALRAIKPAEAPKAQEAKKNEPAPKEQGTKGRKPGGGKFAGKVIVPRKETNPRRAGTIGFRSFEIIKGRIEGVPFEEYIKKGGRAKDLQWDIDHKWAEVRDEKI